jgi:hypothetical protein
MNKNSFDPFSDTSKALIDRLTTALSLPAKYGINDKLPSHQLQQLALLVKNQTEYAQNSGLTPAEERQLVLAIWKNSPLFDIVSVQTQFTPNDVYYYHTKEGWQEGHTSAKTKNLAAQFAQFSPESLADLKEVHGIDAWAKSLLLLGEKIKAEIFREVTADFRQLGAHSRRFPSFDAAENFLEAKFNEESNWVVTSPRMAQKVFGYFHNHPAIEKVFIDGKAVWIDPVFPEHEMLLGCKKGDYDPGIVYRPYVAFILSDIIMDADSFVPRRHVMHRYAKRASGSPHIFALVNESLVDQEVADSNLCHRTPTVLKTDDMHAADVGYFYRPYISIDEEINPGDFDVSPEIKMKYSVNRLAESGNYYGQLKIGK